MRDPLAVLAVTGHLAWGGDGSVWAAWEVDPFPYAHRSVRGAWEVHAATVALLLALPGEALVLSVARALSPLELEERMGRPLHPSRAEACCRVAQQAALRAAPEGLFSRLVVLAARLPDPGGGGGVRGGLRASRWGLAASLGLPPDPPSARAVAERSARAAELEARIAPHLPLRPLRAVELRWLYERAPLRGLAEPPWPAAAPRPEQVSVVRLDRDALYWEGGRPEDRSALSHRRFLAIEHPDQGAGYQAFACLGEMPRSWTFPYGSGEWLWHLDDQLPFPIDWAVRLSVVPNQAARQRAVRARRNLVGATEHPSSDPAGLPTTLAPAARAVDDHRARLEANPELPALRATTIVCLAHRDLAELERRAAALEAAFRPAEFGFYRPTGDQLSLFSAMLPASPSPAVVSEFAQDLLPDGLASGMPFASSEVGDPGGILVGRSLDSPLPRPVFLDPARGPQDLDRSGSLAAVGELGSGKSYLQKTLCFEAVAAGAQVVAIDRTERGEYRALAGLVGGRSQVVEVTGAEVALDPFAVFSSDQERLRYGVGFCTLLTATPPSSVEGALLWRVAEGVLSEARREGRAARLAELVERLRDGERGAASRLGEKLSAFSGLSWARAAFSTGAGVADLSADFTCFHLPGLRLPHPGADRDDLLPEEAAGRALLYLVAAFSRRLLLRDPTRLAVLVVDEAHALTSNPQGWALLEELIRDGRKHFAAVWAASQLASDFLSSQQATDDLDTLLGYRAVFRQSPKTAAEALRFLGTEDRPGTRDLVTSLRTGECLLRDLEGRLGVVRISEAWDPRLRRAFSTTPAPEGQPPEDPTLRAAVAAWAAGARRAGVPAQVGQ